MNGSWCKLFALSACWLREVELSLSTRESPWFRDRVIPLAINNVSAFSKTQPGGYADKPSGAGAVRASR
ncbi:thiazole biosynthesis protein ThiH [Klebsiella michiganensis]|uniref:Thiazole biosynthesis protein ThiH n=1 Tax=Klebsiella michiganensis TaxID=1134687 RepID=A0A7H4PDS3_9ENTR|nr:thiazole biosynthesis protein ThiH [Klebsiella michiganensis]